MHPHDLALPACSAGDRKRLVPRPWLIPESLGEVGQRRPVGDMSGGEPEDPPPKQCGAIEFIVVRSEPGTSRVPAPAGDPCPSIDLDGEQAVGPCEIEAPAPAEMPGEFVFGLRLRESRRPDQDQEPEFKWRRCARGLGFRECAGACARGSGSGHVLTMRPPVHPRGRGWSPDWGNPGWERRNGPPRPHHGRSGAGRRVRRDAGGCGRDDPRDGR